MSPGGRSKAEAQRRGALQTALGEATAAALHDKAVVELLINADGRLWLDRVGEGLIETQHVFTRAERETAIRLLAHEAGEIVNENNPALSAILPGSAARVQAVLPPLVEAPVLSIRKRPALIYRLDDYVAQGAATPAQAQQLSAAVRQGLNIVVAGGTGAGKTTLLNALLAEEAFAQARVVLLEDTAELQCVSPNRVELLTRTRAPIVDMRMLVRMTMRLRPDRIVVGEVRDGAALEVLKAWNTGHPGGLLSLHANSASDALLRLEDLAGEASASSPKRLIDQAVDLVVFIRRTPSGRVIDDVLALKSNQKA